VLCDHDRVVGVLVLMPRDDYLLLDNIAVHPDHHGQGLGGRLLALADEEAARLGYRELRLYTHITMTGNVALYKAKGWVVTGQGVEDGYERIFMSRRLDP
jgi:GNAT superfamily N-acetyltransferase